MLALPDLPYSLSPHPALMGIGEGKTSFSTIFLNSQVESYKLTDKRQINKRKTEVINVRHAYGALRDG